MLGQIAFEPYSIAVIITSIFILFIVISKGYLRRSLTGTGVATIVLLILPFAVQLLLKRGWYSLTIQNQYAILSVVIVSSYLLSLALYPSRKTQEQRG